MTLRRYLLAAIIGFHFISIQANSNPSRSAPLLTGIRLIEPGVAEVSWRGATEGITVEFTPSLHRPTWMPIPDYHWPAQGSTWTGPLPTIGSQIYLRLAVPGTPQTAQLVVFDSEKDDAGFLREDSKIPINLGDTTDYEFIGSAYVNEAPFSKGFRLFNTGTSILSVFAIEVKGSEQTLSVSLPNPGMTMPLEITPGEQLDLQITATTATPGLHISSIEIESSDPSSPIYSFNMVAVIGDPRTLLCSGDNDNWVEANFSCVGKPNGTLCGGTEEGMSRVCNQNECVLLGDANSDGYVNQHDIEDYLAALVTGQSSPALDLDCDGKLNESPRERQMLANLISDADNFEAYNSRAVEGCLGRDLIRNLTAYPEKGLGYAFTNGDYIDLEAMQRLEPDGQLKATTPIRYKEPILVCLDSLGVFDSETGEPLVIPWGVIDPVTGKRPRIGNEGKLTGFFLEAIVQAPHRAFQKPLTEFVRTNNDFRVYFKGDQSRPGELPSGLGKEEILPAKDAHLWAAAVQSYHDITRHRHVFLNKKFINKLKLSSDFEQNVLFRQYRPDLQNLGTVRTSKFQSHTLEAPGPFPSLVGAGCILRASGNHMNCNASHVYNREEADIIGRSQWDEILNFMFNPGAAADYLGLVAFWLIKDPQGFPADTGFDSGSDMSWILRVTPSINDGISTWEEYRLTGSTNLLFSQHGTLMDSRWPYKRIKSECSSGSFSCSSTSNIDNVGTYNGDQPNPATYPFYPKDNQNSPNNLKTIHDHFFPAIIYDLSHGMGLGDQNTSLIFWKTLGYITNSHVYPMPSFAADLLRASRELYPDSKSLAGQSLFEEGWVQILSARGMPLQGRSPLDNLLPAVRDVHGRSLASSHPLPQLQDFGSKVFETGVFEGNSEVSYLALQFHPFCRLGPCDSLEVTNGSYDEEGQYSPADISPYRHIFEDRDLANLVLLVPGRQFAWKVNANKCDIYMRPDFRMDVAAFGFRVVNAQTNGFGIDTGRTIDGVTVLEVVDPSDLGQNLYEWRFKYLMTGQEITMTGHKVFPRDIYKGPVSLEIIRNSGEETHSIRYLTLGGTHSRPKIQDLTSPSLLPMP